MVLIVLPVVGFTIVNAYQKHMVSAIEKELVAHSYAILAVAEVEQKELQMPELLLENQFNVINSGLYALINSASEPKKTLWQSQSLFAVELPDLSVQTQVGDKRFYQIKGTEQGFFIYSLTVSFAQPSQQDFALSLNIIKSNDAFNDLMQEFKTQLWLGLIGLMVVLLSLQYIWLTWSLKPLVALKNELIAIEQGKTEKLEENYPKELSLVTQQLNTLLKAEQNQRKRYRNALSDLAHSLKTPLAVIQAQEQLSPLAQEQLTSINLMIAHQLKRAQSAGQASWHLGVELAPCLDKLTNSLSKIYHQKSPHFIVEIAKEVVFKGDEADLFELLGNLLDNACKAANSHILITATTQDKQLLITVEDDGCGIMNSEKEKILQRGTRADTYQQGHGIGLAIVRDLIESYQGQLTIGTSQRLGGAKFSLSFTY